MVVGGGCGGMVVVLWDLGLGLLVGVVGVGRAVASDCVGTGW